MRGQRGEATRFDLEDPRDLRQLAEPTLALGPLRGLVVLDEIQQRPDLFAVLRVLADRTPRPTSSGSNGSTSCTPATRATRCTGKCAPSPWPSCSKS
jgi:predicted AAA+ superfamily ATPase